MIKKKIPRKKSTKKKQPVEDSSSDNSESLSEKSLSSEEEEVETFRPPAKYKDKKCNICQKPYKLTTNLPIYWLECKNCKNLLCHKCNLKLKQDYFVDYICESCKKPISQIQA